MPAWIVRKLARLNVRSKSAFLPADWKIEGAQELIPGNVATLRAYAPPTLTWMASTEDLIEALGPAHAGYGGAGLIP